MSGGNKAYVFSMKDFEKEINFPGVLKMPSD